MKIKTIAAAAALAAVAADADGIPETPMDPDYCSAVKSSHDLTRQEDWEYAQMAADLVRRDGHICYSASLLSPVASGAGGVVLFCNDNQDFYHLDLGERRVKKFDGRFDKFDGRSDNPPLTDWDVPPTPLEPGYCSSVKPLHGLTIEEDLNYAWALAALARSEGHNCDSVSLVWHDSSDSGNIVVCNGGQDFYHVNSAEREVTRIGR